MKKYLLQLFSACIFLGAYMAHAASSDECEVHFEIKLSTHAGEWKTYAHYASEDGTAVLPEKQCQKVAWFEPVVTGGTKHIQLSRAFTIKDSTVTILGHQNGTYADFYGVLVITAVLKPSNIQRDVQREPDNDSDRFTATDSLASPPPKMCVFYIGAKGPAMPVQFAKGFEGAKCFIRYIRAEGFYMLTVD